MGEFDALLADVVHAGVAEHVAGNLAQRIVTAVFALQRHTRHLERHDACDHVRRGMTLEVHELAGFVFRQQLREFARVHAEHSGQFRQPLPGLDQRRRMRPDRIHRRADRQRRAVAIENHAAV